MRAPRQYGILKVYVYSIYHYDFFSFAKAPDTLCKEQRSTVHRTCTFCDIVENPSSEVRIDEARHMIVIKNLFPYTLWDGSPVEDHLMIIPKRHLDSAGALNEHEQAEWAKLALKFEKENYSVYARSAGNGAKSIAHQHTHLIKVGARPRRLRTLWSLYKITTGE